MSVKAKCYWMVIVAVGVAVIALASVQWQPRNENLFEVALYLAAAVATSSLKIRLPGVFGTLSMNYLFIIAGLLNLQLESVVLIGLVSVLAQCLIRPTAKPRWEQLVFSTMSIPLPILAADWVLHLRLFATIDSTHCLALISASMAYFIANTWTVATIIGLTSGKSAATVWTDSFIWTSPQYLVGGVIAGVVNLATQYVPWQGILLSAPPLYLVYRSYSLYLGRVEQQQKHIAEMAHLHWRTIEALALAIEAKDDTTAAHLRRVRVYAAEVGKELDLSEAEMKALEAASLLHDIGKLAVPEYIISKPGRLTPEEFDKMKIHPVVGAEILERVNFPYPVAPIVRSHHEKYDGTGYPDGLRGAEIPIGARILAAVDCLDALASDRQYRPGLPLDQAMDMVARESGISFDPQVVEVLQRRHREMELKAKAHSEETLRTVRQPIVERGAPGAGFANDEAKALPESNFTLAIAGARREVQSLVEITNDLGNSLSLDKTLTLLALRLGNIIPHDTIAIYIRKGEKLCPEFVKGEGFRFFSSLEIPIGQGLSGWVAENDRPIVNGNPAVEPAYLKDPAKQTSLRSAISVPLRGQDGVMGALTLYSLRSDAFNQDHLRVLLAIRLKAGLTIENSLRFGHAKTAAENDELTGLLNAGSVFRLLSSEIAASAATHRRVAVLVLDLDGFKVANDLHGHMAGNRILQEVAAGLKQFCRRTDHVARMGGDEFVLVLPDADDLSIAGILGRIHELGPEAGMKTCGERLITISAGVAVFPKDGADAESLLEAADRQMYEAKRSRSNRRVA